MYKINKHFFFTLVFTFFLNFDFGIFWAIFFSNSGFTRNSFSLNWKKLNFFLKINFEPRRANLASELLYNNLTSYNFVLQKFQMSSPRTFRLLSEKSKSLPLLATIHGPHLEIFFGGQPGFLSLPFIFSVM